MYIFLYNIFKKQSYFNSTKSADKATCWTYYQWHGNCYVVIDNSVCRIILHHTSNPWVSFIMSLSKHLSLGDFFNRATTNICLQLEV